MGLNSTIRAVDGCYVHEVLICCKGVFLGGVNGLGSLLSLMEWLGGLLPCGGILVIFKEYCGLKRMGSWLEQVFLLCSGHVMGVFLLCDGSVMGEIFYCVIVL